MLPLSSAARRWLMEVARSAVEDAARGRRAGRPDPPKELPDSDRKVLNEPRPAFVTLTKQGRLRGCVGHVACDTPLYEVVADMARSAALHDTRFPPVAADEVPELQIEISVLSPLVPITPEQIIPGIHGLMVRQGFFRGLLLPQVATEYKWDAEQFLREACRKAGLPPDAWKRGATVEAFTAEVIGEEETLRNTA